MPEWHREEGIGETRLALVDGEDILEARILPHGIVQAGEIVPARLIKRGPNGVARSEAGDEYLLPQGVGDLTEGSAFDLVVTRSAIPGTEPWKRPLAKVGIGQNGPSEPAGAIDRTIPPAWDDLIEEARSGIVRFAGGELRISPTPAMTLIDVDGTLAADALAVAGATAAARTIRRLDIGGSIGIDLPTVSGKTARQAAAAAIDANLPQPFERTAINGFGFVQIVRPRRRASIVELAQDHAAFEARDLLRRCAAGAAGPRRLVGHPRLIAVLEDRADWLDALSRQLGGNVGLRADPKLPISGAYAEPF